MLKMSKPDDRKTYMLVVEFEGETDIFQLSYDTTWENFTVLLQVKYDCEEMPDFAYLDDEDDHVILDSQDAFVNALTVSHKNDDVLHIKMQRKTSASVSQSSEKSELQQVKSKSPLTNSIAWASGVVRQAVKDLGHGLITLTATETSVNMEELDTRTERLESDNVNTDQLQAAHPAPSACKASSGQFAAAALEEPQEVHNRDSATSVKEPLTALDEISVPTSVNTSDTEEMSVKLPLGPSTSAAQELNQKHEGNVVDPDVILKIKEEVRSAVSEELKALREEINSKLLLRTIKEKKRPPHADTSDDSYMEQTRSPKAIKREIRELRREMKASKLQKRRKQATQSSADEGSRDESEDRQVRKFAASFICENLLDGSRVGAGQSFTKYWVLKNEGTRSWDQKIKLELLKETPSPDGSPVDPDADEQSLQRRGSRPNKWGPETTSVALPVVNASETNVIAVRHVAPDHTCNYTSSWRLHRKGRPFGPRIWCAVAVVDAEDLPDASCEPSSVAPCSDEEQSYVKATSHWTHRQTPPETHHSAAHDDSLSNMLSFDMENIGEEYDADHQTSHPSAPEVGYPSEIHRTEETKVVPTEPVPDGEPMEVIVADKQPSTEEQDHPMTEEFEPLISVCESQNGETNEEEKQCNPEDSSREAADPVQQRLRDKELESDTDTSSTGDASDFEVIPLPECFDTTRPLSGSDREAASSQPCSLSSKHGGSMEVDSEAQQQQREEAGASRERHAAVGALVTSEEGTEDATAENVPVSASSSEEQVPGSVEEDRDNTAVQQQDEEDVATGDEGHASDAEVVREEQSMESEQSTPLDVAEAAAAPKPVPQSVLDMDQPCPVTDFSQGYELPVQKSVEPPQPWLSQPIALPRAVLDANEAWITPAPQPRSRTKEVSHHHEEATSDAEETRFVPSGSLVRRQIRANDSSGQQVSQEPNPQQTLIEAERDSTDTNRDILFDDENPQILYPPLSEDVTLAPEPANPSAFPGEAPSLEEPYNPSPMAQLIEMGFTDVELNRNVLSEFEGNVARAVQALLYSSDADETRPMQHSRRPRPIRSGYHMA